FNEFWKQVAFPVLLEGAYEDEYDLMERWADRLIYLTNLHEAYLYNEFGFGGILNKLKGALGMGGGQQQPQAPATPPVGAGGDNGGVNLNPAAGSGDQGVGM